MRRLERRVRDEHNLHVVARLQVLHPVALLVEEERGHFDRQLRDNLRGALLARLLADNAQDRKRQRLDAADRADAGAARAGQVAGFTQRRPQALPRHLEQAETRDLADLDTRAVLADGLAQPVFHVTLMLLRAHVDEVDNDQATQVSNTELAGDFIRRLEVGIQRRCLDVAALGRAGRVDVDRHQRLGMVDDDAAAGRQVYRVRERRLDLALDLEPRE